jgi:hypothetical protein
MQGQTRPSPAPGWGYEHKDKMKLHKDIKPELACSKDENRWILHHPYLDVENKALVATDGRIMAIIPCHPENGELSGPVSREALENGRKNSQRDGTFHCVMNGFLAVVGGGTFSRPDYGEGGRFPNWQQVLPKFEEMNATPKASGLVEFAFGLELLTNLAKAIGHDKARGLRFKLIVEDGAVLGPIIVQNSHDSDLAHYNPEQPDMERKHPLGILMPMRLS